MATDFGNRFDRYNRFERMVHKNKMNDYIFGAVFWLVVLGIILTAVFVGCRTFGMEQNLTDCQVKYDVENMTITLECQGVKVPSKCVEPVDN